MTELPWGALRAPASVLVRPTFSRSTLAAAVSSVLAVVASDGTALAWGGNTPGSGPFITNADLPWPGYTDTGDTSASGYTNDGDADLLPGCPNGPSSSPDAWYRLEITEAISIRIDLCASAYDTKTYVTTPDMTVIACNDDACPGFRSILETGDLAPGSYHLAVDGAYGGAGAYSLTVTDGMEPQPCVLDPPCTGVLEEETCEAPYEDTTNGGCNSSPPVFGSITIDGPSICGTGWAVGGTRDTDWFAFSVDEPVSVDIHLNAEADKAAFVVAFPKGIGSCTGLTVLGEVATSVDCGVNTPGGAELTPGDYVLFTGSSPADCLPPICPPCASLHAYELSIVTRPPPPPPCPWDLDGDDGVGFADLLGMLEHWGCCPGYVPSPTGECVAEGE